MSRIGGSLTQAIVPGAIEDGEVESKLSKGGRKARGDLQVAVIEVLDELAKIDVALNLAELEWKKAEEKHKREVSNWSQKRTVAAAKLRDATEAVAKRQVPGSTQQ